MEAEAKILKAYNRLKEFKLFSDDFETFRHFFYDNLKKNRKDEAIEVLLMTIFYLFKSNGEKLNNLLSIVDKQNKEKIVVWLESTYKKELEKVKND